MAVKARAIKSGANKSRSTARGRSTATSSRSRLPSKPRNTAATSRSTRSTGETGPITPPRVIRARIWFVGLFMLAPLVWLWWSFALHQTALPSEPVIASSKTRGRIMLRDGTVLAESYQPKREKKSDPLPDMQRAYPLGTLAGHLIGFKGRDKGLSGLETFEDTRLKSGQDVVLTIDPVAQAAAEAALERIRIKQQAQAASVVMLEQGTNRVLVMANAPSFNPASIDLKVGLPADIETLWQNRATRRVFEPGSTTKALIAAALIDSGKVTPETTMDVPMSKRIGRHIINDVLPRRNPDGSKMTRLSLTQILRYSSNVGISSMAERMGAQKTFNYLSHFGFGSRVELNGAPSRAGVLRDPKDWKPVDFATATFGQGISTTALGLATSFSVITNNGLLIPPTLIEGESQPEGKQVISRSAAEQTRTMLKTAVEEGIPWAATIKGYCIGGKTGTAQVSVNGRYSQDVYDALFVGFFPCDAPKVTMVVEVLGPKKQNHGSQVAAPVFREIAEEVLAAWGIAPGKDGSKTGVKR
jgi:cell division protein FtsI (penicillin-binding protein 3)